MTAIARVDEAVRRILVNHARDWNCLKRGGGRVRFAPPPREKK